MLERQVPLSLRVLSQIRSGAVSRPSTKAPSFFSIPAENHKSGRPASKDSTTFEAPRSTLLRSIPSRNYVACNFLFPLPPMIILNPYSTRRTKQMTFSSSLPPQTWLCFHFLRRCRPFFLPSSTPTIARTHPDIFMRKEQNNQRRNSPSGMSEGLYMTERVLDRTSDEKL